MLNTYRETILKKDILIGEKRGYPLIVRPITSGATMGKTLEFSDNRTDLPAYKRAAASFKTPAICPALFLVIWGTKRLDGFLHKKKMQSVMLKLG